MQGKHQLVSDALSKIVLLINRTEFSQIQPYFFSKVPKDLLLW